MADRLQTRFEHGQLVTATHPITGHAITGEWDANRASILIDSADRRGAWRVPLEQLRGYTFTSTPPRRPGGVQDESPIAAINVPRGTDLDTLANQLDIVFAQRSAAREVRIG